MYQLNFKLLKNKTILFGLITIFGLGIKISKSIIKKLGLSKNLKILLLNSKQLSSLTNFLFSLNLILMNNLKKYEYLTFQKKINIKYKKAQRKLENLPVRGQRTHTNARTVKKLRLKSFLTTINNQ